MALSFSHARVRSERELAARAMKMITRLTVFDSHTYS